MHRHITIGFAARVLAVAAGLATGVSRLEATPSVFVPGEATKWGIYMPHPQYPDAALGHRRPTGTGIFVLRVKIETGRVKNVDVARTTGDPTLDGAAVAALRQWRFKPRVLPPIKSFLPHMKDPFASEDSLIKVPVTFYGNPAAR